MNWFTSPQNPVTTGMSGHLSDHDDIAAALGVLLGAAMQGLPTNAIQQTIPRYAINSTSASIGATTGTVYMAAMWLPAGVTITNLNWLTGNTAASAPTHWWLGIADFGGVQRAHTADQTTGAITSNTLVTKALTATYTTPSTGLYYLLISVTATTNPTSTAFTTSGVAMTAVTPLLAGISGSAAQPAPGTDGTTTYSLPVSAAGVAYMYAT